MSCRRAVDGAESDRLGASLRLVNMALQIYTGTLRSALSPTPAYMPTPGQKRGADLEHLAQLPGFLLSVWVCVPRAPRAAGRSNRAPLVVVDRGPAGVFGNRRDSRRLADQETRACGLGNPPPAAAAAAESGNGGFPDPDIRPNRESV